MTQPTQNFDPQNPVQRVRPEGDALVVDVAGDVDLHRSVEFQQSLLKLLDGKPGRIVLNLAAVPYMDSSGVASLVKLLTRAGKAKVGLKLCCLNDRVRGIFEITRLDTIFPICGSIEEALA